MKKSVRIIALAATLASQALWVAGPGLTWAAPSVQPIDQRVRESERKQQMIRTQTQRIGEDLGAIINEFENNGLGEGEDVKVLRAIKSVLGKLSDKEMARIIELLGAARGDDAAKSKSRVAEAFGGQKTVVVELRQLLLEYERQQELYALSLRFAQLAARQNGNLKDAKRLVRTSQGRNLDRFDENQKISLSVQKDEQTAIRDESLGVINKLGVLARDTDSATAERLNESLQAAQKNKVEESLRNAVEELKGATLYRATKSEQDARNQLRELSRLVAPVRDTQEILRQAAAELERLVIEQKLTISQTQLLVNTGRQLEEAYFDAEEREGDIVDRADMVQKEIEHLCPLGSEQCKKAEDRMQESRSTILEKKRDDSIKNQEQAIVHLDAARKLVLEELNKQEKKDEIPVDKLAEAKALKDKVTALKQEEEKVKKETDATKQEPRKAPEKLAELSPAQAKLQTEARELQPEAAQASVPVADAIAEAAREMGKAKDALEKKEKVEQATAPEQAAIDNLARAEKLLDKEIAALEQAQADLDALEKAREKVAELIKTENKIEIATAKAEAQQKAADPADPAKPDAAKPDAAKPNAAKPDSAKPDAAKPDAAKPDGAKPDAAKPDAAKPDAAKSDAAKPDQKAKEAAAQAAADTKALAPEQSKNADDTAAVAAELPAAGQDAIAPLNEAKGNQDQAKGALAKPDAAAARPDEKKALANLEKAKDALDKKIGDLQAQLGQPADAQATADLAQAIAPAQTDIAPATDAAQADPGQGDKPQGDAAKGDKAPGDKAQGEKVKGDKGAQEAKALAKTAENLANAAADANAPPAVEQYLKNLSDTEEK